MHFVECSADKNLYKPICKKENLFICGLQFSIVSAFGMCVFRASLYGGIFIIGIIRRVSLSLLFFRAFGSNFINS